MGFLDSVIRGAEFRAASGLARPAEWLNSALGGTSTFSGQRVTVEKTLGMGPVYAAVSMIADAVLMCPLKVYRDFEGDKAEAREHRAWRMLHDAPNSHSPAARFWSTVTAQLLLWGNVFLVKVRNELSLVDTLELLPPAEITIKWNGVRKQFVHDSASGRKVWSDEEVLHIWGFSTDGLTGLSPIATCRHDFGTVLARNEFEGGFYRRGALMSGALKHSGRLSEQAQKNLKESVQGLFGGSGNAHQIMVLEEGMEFSPLSMTLEDLQFVESKQLSRTDIATIFKLPPAYLGGSTGDSLTYATVESNQIQFANLAVAPWTVAIGDSLAADRGIFPQTVFYPEFVLEGLLRGDAKSRAEYYQLMHGMKAMTRNEIRAKENMAPVAGGDEFEKEPEPPEPSAEPSGNGEVPPQLVLPSASGPGNSR